MEPTILTKEDYYEARLSDWNDLPLDIIFEIFRVSIFFFFSPILRLNEQKTQWIPKEEMNQIRMVSKTWYRVSWEVRIYGRKLHVNVLVAGPHLRFVFVCFMT